MRAPAREPRRALGGGARQPVEIVSSSDGRSFPKLVSDRIDRLVHLVFNNANGRELMEVLEGMTLRTVLPATSPEAILRDMEGQRRLVAMLKQRARRAEAIK